MLAHAKESADADDDGSGLAGFVENHIADIADLLVLFVVDIDARELRCPPAVLVRGRVRRRRIGLRHRRLRESRSRQQGRRYERNSQFGKHGILQCVALARTMIGQGFGSSWRHGGCLFEYRNMRNVRPERALARLAGRSGKAPTAALSPLAKAILLLAARRRVSCPTAATVQIILAVCNK